MTIKHFAKSIPQELRKKILDENLIHIAVPVFANIEMKFLLKVWSEFIEPGKEISNCAICINTILTNFKQMESILIEVENEYQYLNLL
jgi:hypothetical protein